MTSFLGFRYLGTPKITPIRVRADVSGLNTERDVQRQSGHRWDIEQPLSGKGLSYSPLRAHQVKYDAETPFLVPMPQETGANGESVGMTDYPASVRFLVQAPAPTAGSTAIGVRCNTAGTTLYGGRYISFTGHQTDGTLVMVYMVSETVTFTDASTTMSVEIQPGLLAALTVGSLILTSPMYRGKWQPEAVDAGIPNTIDGYFSPILDMWGEPVK